MVVHDAINGQSKRITVIMKIVIAEDVCALLVIITAFKS